MVHFHLDIKILVYVVWKSNTHENKGIDLYFQVLVVKKYLHSQAHIYGLGKALNVHDFCSISSPANYHTNVHVCANTFLATYYHSSCSCLHFHWYAIIVRRIDYILELNELYIYIQLI